MKIAVCIVTYDSAADLPGCLRSVAGLGPGVDIEVCVVDNASRDGSAALAERLLAELCLAGRVVRRSDNAGFSVGMNDAIAATESHWVLALNPDARPEPDYVQQLVERAEACDAAGLRVGALTGRLTRPAEGSGPPKLDACGMVLRRTWRHLDRGSGESDADPSDMRYGEAQQVFGATGAAALYRREALLDVAIPAGDETLAFDPLFHSYREDAELCFRLHERGWSVVYEPAARCEHRRAVVPTNRRLTSDFVNFHSLKNRYLLRAYHETVATLWKTLPFALVRDLGALLWVLVAERSSLRAYAWLWRHRREWWRRAMVVRSRRLVSTSQVARWFSVSDLPLTAPRNSSEPS